jgi:ketosteroid isomerase-like protein
VRDTQPVTPQENVEVVRRGFMAAMEEDWPTALDTLDPAAEIRDFDIPDAGVYRGHAGFLAWLQGWGEGWESWRTDEPEFRAIGDDGVIALFRIVARGGHSGLELERDDAIVYRLREGRIVRLEYFNDQSRALEAVRQAT